MKIGIDAMGGDFAPLEAVKGAALSAQQVPGVRPVLFGQSTEIQKIMASEGISSEAFDVIDCPEIIGMSEHPVKAIAGKPGSSIVVGFTHLAQGSIDAFLSAGNTGAMFVGAMNVVKPIAGIQRPCLTSVVPRIDHNPGLILDVGANADVKPEHLLQFGILGSVFYQCLYKTEHPKVGLLNIGEEEEKGSILTKAAHALLKANQEINFVGNVEGRDIFSNDFDVVVCDGFSGNILIKVCEGLYYRLAKRGVQDDYLDKFNFKHYGGSALLGVNSPVIIGHGISKAQTFVKMVEMARDMVENKMVENIKNQFSKLNQSQVN